MESKLGTRVGHSHNFGMHLAFKLHCATWILEDGIPCSLRRPRQYFTETGLNWEIVHARYEDDIKGMDPDARTLSYSRFTHYIHFYYTGVRLTRTAEDVYDCCVRLEIRLKEPGITEDEKKTLLLEKTPAPPNDIIPDTLIQSVLLI
ncbi:Cleavage inducible protein [Phytophthora palmivora]|uniref:Cleavage inducible protein n=1 Tax=Phytophthora palmivora TaxID=4796 RepID=A0A2P4WZZ7_9STRA|nr:Cleavage inducible protein [Phytophthora palmivora]